MDAECEFSPDCQNVDFCRNIAVSWYCSKSPESTHFNHLNKYVTFSSLSKTLPEFRNSGCLVRLSFWVLCCGRKLLGGRAVWRSGVLQLHGLRLQVVLDIVKAKIELVLIFLTA